MAGGKSTLYDTLHKIGEQKVEAVKAAAVNAGKVAQEESEDIQKIADQVAEKFSGTLGMGGTIEAAQEKEIAAFIESRAEELPGATMESKEVIRRATLDRVLKFGKLQNLMEDAAVTDINVVGPDMIRVERSGVSTLETGIHFEADELKTLIQRVMSENNRQIDQSHQTANARFSDGSRICAVISPATTFPTLAIRKFTNSIQTPEDYIRTGTLSREMLRFLEICVRGKINIIVSGGTGAGKTTLLNMLSSYIPDNEYVITIEDTQELRLQQRCVTNMVANENVSLADLVDTTLRLNPDRIIVGEVRTRDGVLSNMITAMSTGHDGSMSTIHANDPYDLVNTRIDRLYDNTSTNSVSREAIRQGFSSAVQMIVHIKKMPNGRRVVTHITAVTGLLKSGEIKLDSIYKFDYENGFVRGIKPSKIILRAKANGVIIPENMLEGWKEKDG